MELDKIRLFDFSWTGHNSQLIGLIMLLFRSRESAFWKVNLTNDMTSAVSKILGVNEIISTQMSFLSKCVDGNILKQ